MSNGDVSAAWRRWAPPPACGATSTARPPRPPRPASPSCSPSTSTTCTGAGPSSSWWTAAGEALAAGDGCDVELPWAYVVEGWALYADQSGSAVLDLRTATYATFPTLTSICGGAKPTLSGAQKNQATDAQRLDDHRPAPGHRAAPRAGERHHRHPPLPDPVREGRLAWPTCSASATASTTTPPPTPGASTASSPAPSPPWPARTTATGPASRAGATSWTSAPAPPSPAGGPGCGSTSTRPPGAPPSTSARCSSCSPAPPRTPSSSPCGSTPTGSVSVRRDTTGATVVAASAAGVFAFDRWVYVTYSSALATTATGRCDVFLDGISVLSATAVITCTGTPRTANHERIGNCLADGNAVRLDVDDFASFHNSSNSSVGGRPARLPGAPTPSPPCSPWAPATRPASPPPGRPRTGSAAPRRPGDGDTTYVTKTAGTDPLDLYAVAPFSTPTPVLPAGQQRPRRRPVPGHPVGPDAGRRGHHLPGQRGQPLPGLRRDAADHRPAHDADRGATPTTPTRWTSPAPPWRRCRWAGAGAPRPATPTTSSGAARCWWSCGTRWGAPRPPRRRGQRWSVGWVG